LIPDSAKTILDVGCGEGLLGEQLLQRGAQTVVGVELHPAAASRARHRLTAVIQGNIETDPLPWAPGTFDAVICADILEHLVDPWTTLRKLAAYLTPDGMLIASIPNARYLALIAGLVDGHWTYQSEGLLDFGHLRFFTLSEITSLVDQAGLRLTKLLANMGPLYTRYQNTPSRQEIRLGRLCITDVGPEEFIEFFVFQYLIQATRTAYREAGA